MLMMVEQERSDVFVVFTVIIIIVYHPFYIVKTPDHRSTEVLFHVFLRVT